MRVLKRVHESVSMGDSYLKWFAEDLDNKLGYKDSLDLIVSDIGEILIELKGHNYYLYKLTLRPKNSRSALHVTSINDGKDRIILKLDSFSFTSNEADSIKEVILKDMRNRKDIKFNDEA